MPLNIPDQLIHELVMRQIAEEGRRMPPIKFADDAPDQPTPMKPETLALLGGLADAVSTYSFLKRGTGDESNPLYGPLKGNPLATGAAVAGASLGAKLLRDLVRSKVPPLRRLMDALGAQQGATQLGYAASNFARRRGSPSAQAEYDQALINRTLNAKK